MGNPRAKIVSLKISPNMIKSSLGGFDLYWDVQSVGFTPTFNPQFSSSGDANIWNNVNITPVSIYFLKGIGPKRLSFQEDLFFRLQVLNGSTVVETSVSQVAGQMMNRHDWNIYREMLRREALELNKYTGDPGALLRRIVYGTPCTNCIDETLNDPASTECENCLGTGFEDGYYVPVFSKINWSDQPSAPNNTTLETGGPSEIRVVEAIFPAHPSVKFKDVYVDLATKQRYEIQSAITDEYRGATIRQVVTMSRLPISDPVYQYAIAPRAPLQVPRTNDREVAGITPEGVINGVNTTFRIPNYYSTNIAVFLNGLIAEPSDFVVSLYNDGILLVLNVPPQEGDTVTVTIFL